MLYGFYTSTELASPSEEKVTDSDASGSVFATPSPRQTPITETSDAPTGASPSLDNTPDPGTRCT